MKLLLKRLALQNRHYGGTLMGEYKIIIIIFEFTSVKLY